MKKRILDYEKAKKLFRYCAKTGKLYWKHGRYRNQEVGSISKHGYLKTFIFNQYYQVHRIVWLICKGEFPQNNIDHIDRNTLNNRIKNLRDVSTSENNRNMPKNRANTSGVMGVYWHRSAHKWVAQIQFNKKWFYLGAHEKIEDAAIARKKASRKLGFHFNHGTIPH